MRAAIQGGIDVALQPIVELASGAVIGVEALARFPDGRAPDVWFAEAAEAGLGVDLEIAAVRAALARLPGVPDGAYLAVNVSPLAVCAPALATAIAAAPAERLVLEITEHAPIPDDDALARALTSLRALGVRLAVDDAGAGFASLRCVLRLRPDVVKLDASLIRGIDADLRKRALVRALVRFARAARCSLVAEGIETAGEQRCVRSLGVGAGQGFYLGVPSADIPVARLIAPAPRLLGALAGALAFRLRA